MKNARANAWDRTDGPTRPPAGRWALGGDDTGHTINGARHPGIEAHQGSIEADRDAGFPAFENDLTTAGHGGFSFNRPRGVYFCDRKMNDRL